MEKMTVEELLHSMTQDEIGKLYMALLRIDEVQLLGDGLLMKLFKAVDDEGVRRDLAAYNHVRGN